MRIESETVQVNKELMNNVIDHSPLINLMDQS